MNIEINEKNFPDENFRKFISDKFDKFGNGYLTKNFIDKITVLECTGKEIKSVRFVFLLVSSSINLLEPQSKILNSLLLLISIFMR